MSIAAQSLTNLRTLEGLIRKHGFGGTLQRTGKLRQPPLPSGIACLDAPLGGGLPRGAISEINGRSSSGRTGLVLAALAEATRAGEIAAYVDATDCLDPRSAAETGVVLERLLWIRCDAVGHARCPPGDPAWQAANLAVSAGVFGVVALDLGGLSEQQMGRWQRRPWMRLKRAVEGTSTALIALAEKHLAGIAADMVVELRRGRTEWDGMLGRAAIRAEIVKHRMQRSIGQAAGEAA